MKKAFLFFSVGILASSCYNRIGDLNLVSNRNIGFDQKYQLLQRDVVEVIKTKKSDALEQAIDDATAQANGEFIMNAKIYVKRNGRKLKIVGDVWGIPTQVEK